ncbi:MAG: hypothetical protein EKK53_25325 [Burkholderiales bacterium]|nr:MAG: hypothetical protein EKK53_25325 [Burkholderiales bacterium]
MFLAASGLLGGCASAYLDASVKEVPAAQFKKPAAPGPVQLLFEFQTKGVRNAKATEMLQERVIAQVKASGLFTDVGASTVPSGASLSITLNNVPMSDDAFSKGFLTGLTLGLAGTQVGDGYVCTASYRAPGSSAPVVKQARHAIYTTLGATGGPSNAVKMPDHKEAAFQMTTQVVSNVLNDLSQDASFK